MGYNGLLLEKRRITIEILGRVLKVILDLFFFFAYNGFTIISQIAKLN
ncbi:hypothetical protein PP707_02250 [Acetobacter pasteurianus]|nr:hypothetical protein [Acetobacter pasteurianus]